MKNIKYLLMLIVILGCGYLGYSITKKSNGKTEEKPNITQQPSQPSPVAAQPTPNFEKTVGDFLITDKAVCSKDGKPSIYFFGSLGCPHCVWQKPVMKKVVEKFGKEIDYHENIDNQVDSDIFAQYSNINPGYIPFLTFGCKYARVGAGETSGEEKEIENLTTLICKLTNGKPSSVCNPLKDKYSAIK